jgi:putative ABC transport system permease protein
MTLPRAAIWRISRRDLSARIRGLRLLAICLFLGVATLAAIGSLTAGISDELSRRGHLGGSQELDATSEMSKLRSKAVLEAGTIADGAVRNATANDLSLKAQAKRDIIARAAELATLVDSRLALVEAKSLQRAW